MNLSNSICVVTGGSAGIGRAIAFALGKRGARVAICARTSKNVTNTVKELQKVSVSAVGTACDVSEPKDVERFAAFVHQELGSVDVLVNNAGLGHFVNVEEMTLEQWDETFAVNLRGVFLMTRAFLPDMRKRKRGDIVNIASLAGRNPLAGGAAYSASKHGLLGFSKSLMMEVRKDNIRVIAVCSGSVATPLFRKGKVPAEHPERKLDPDDVAHAVVAALEVADRAMISELDIRPTNP